MGRSKPPLRKQTSHELPLQPLTSADCEAMAQLHQSSFPRGWSAQDLRNLLERPSAHAVGLVQPKDVEREDSLTEKCLLGFCVADRVGDEAEILTLVIHPDQRHRGLGSLLLTLFLEDMQNFAVRAVFLEVAADNFAAIALYEKHHFQVAGRRNLYYERTGAFVDALTMQRRFSAF